MRGLFQQTRARASWSYGQVYGGLDLLRFQRPCLDCGKLSFENRCEKCSQLWASNQRKRLASLPKRIDKSTYYGPQYQRARKEIISNSTTCFLCKQPLGGEGEGARTEVDHLFPSMGADSPLVAVHRFCNRKKSGNDYDPNERY